jgi:uncharacterized protein DUF397
VRESGWFKSSHSGGGNDDCVEVSIAETVGVRDTKDREAGALEVSVLSWAAFTASVS